MRCKTIVIDTSIYIYKYLKDGVENGLETSFTKLIETFIRYNIRPIFIFDGKSPNKKSNLRKERSQIKKQAENEYNRLKNAVILRSIERTFSIMDSFGFEVIFIVEFVNFIFP